MGSSHCTSHGSMMLITARHLASKPGMLLTKKQTLTHHRVRKLGDYTFLVILIHLDMNQNHRIKVVPVARPADRST